MKHAPHPTGLGLIELCILGGVALTIATLLLVFVMPLLAR